MEQTKNTKKKLSGTTTFLNNRGDAETQSLHNQYVVSLRLSDSAEKESFGTPEKAEDHYLPDYQFPVHLAGSV
jgi:hypothetical protein